MHAHKDYFLFLGHESLVDLYLREEKALFTQQFRLEPAEGSFSENLRRGNHLSGYKSLYYNLWAQTISMKTYSRCVLWNIGV